MEQSDAGGKERRERLKCAGKKSGYKEHTFHGNHSDEDEWLSG